ncbi:unnamed protein product [Prorocentrum cordatum]|uniref:Uncharacterized protein n=1 Tax=Prorocentrum cordatum TaxID=2364126 RepID=A0ABN9XJQ8_9DINO|nr:unnamed protein product [Polarella glacialis]
MLPLLGVSARADPSAVAAWMTVGSSFASHISLSSARARCHCLPFAHALIPALRALDDVRLQLRPPHLTEQRQSPVPLFALLARADPSAVADDAWLQLRLPHLAKQRQSLLPLLARRARADPSAVAIAFGSSFASPISLNSARARRHCEPFWHA